MKKFLLDNAKLVFVVVGFAVTLYSQHLSYGKDIVALEARVDKMEQTVEQQYKHMDQIKLDKASFEFAMQNISDMKGTILDIQNDIKKILSQGKYGK